MHTLLLGAVVTGCFLGSAVADSACKGLEKRQCEGKGDCTWVDGYTRKDGVKVDGYCRSVGNRDQTASSKDKESTSKAKQADAESKSEKKATKKGEETSKKEKE
jgi:hypothetical protein